MSNKTKSDTFGSQWIEWAKEEIIALSKIVQEKNAEIERLKGGTPSEEIAMLRDKVKEAEERGAVLMYEFIVSPLCDAYQTDEEILKQFKLWREGRK